MERIKKFRLAGIIMRMAWFLFMFELTLLTAHDLAHGQIPKYAAPDIGKYFASLMMPDQPTTPCCGASDGYYADKVDKCNPKIPGEDSDCALVAIITDMRPDVAPYYENGHRAHIEPGTRIPIPPYKIRKHPVPNPTGHNIVFTSGSNIGWIVYCWEPVGLF